MSLRNVCAIDQSGSRAGAGPSPGHSQEEPHSSYLHSTHALLALIPCGGDPPESPDLLIGEIPELTRAQRPQFQKTDPHAFQLFHQEAQFPEHAAYLVLAALDKRHFEPGVLARPHVADPRRRSLAPLDCYAFAKLAQRLLRRVAVDLDQIGLRHSRTAGENGVG